MKRYSNDKNINQKVRSLIKSGWAVRPGNKHSVLISPLGYRVAIPSTPSDCRTWRNFNRDIRHINKKQEQLHAS
ncbi:phosphoribosylglycinamide formyltransferase [Alcanivorax sp. 97CO-6]|nr:phosphoribosylglycinamide formyltransferase [Alcanivorax sp. 97CO-6]